MGLGGFGEVFVEVGEVFVDGGVVEVGVEVGVEVVAVAEGGFEGFEGFVGEFGFGFWAFE